MKWIPRWEGSLCLEIQKQAVSCVHAVYENVVGVPHYHRGLEILYCLSGKGTFYFGNVSIPYNAPALLLFNGLIPHTAHMAGRYERWNIWIEPASFEQAVQSNMPPLAKQLTTVSEIAVGTVPVELTKILSSIFESIAYELENLSPFYEEIVYHQLLTIMLIAERLVGTQYKRRYGSGMEGILSKSRTLEQLYLFNYIEANLNGDLSARALAEKFHYSEQHIYRTIKKATGRTLGDYIKLRRIERAKALLQTTNMSVTSIADVVGIADITQFSRTFRSIVGCSTSQYRRLLADAVVS